MLNREGSHSVTRNVTTKEITMVEHFCVCFVAVVATWKAQMSQESVLTFGIDILAAVSLFGASWAPRSRRKPSKINLYTDLDIKDKFLFSDRRPFSPCFLCDNGGR